MCAGTVYMFNLTGISPSLFCGDELPVVGDSKDEDDEANDEPLLSYSIIINTLNTNIHSKSYATSTNTHKHTIQT